MKTYHYSVNFKGSDLNHHGEFETVFTDKEQIVSKARKHLSGKLTYFGYTGDDILSIEIYNNERETVFKWKKE